MRFYNRENELDLLQKIRERSAHSAQMTVVIGRRRIGKTSLLKKDMEGSPAIYLFVAKKSEALLCQEFVEAVKSILAVNLFGEITRFRDFFAWIMELSQSRNFTLVLDEFQEFKLINPAVFSEIQNLWDSQKAGSQLNLILCGSVYSMMKDIFENSREPLFSRATAKLYVKPFAVSVLKEILSEANPAYRNEDLLAFYSLTGGVAKYVENFVSAGALTLETMLEEVFSANSLFLEEGKNTLIEEFGRDYTTYFSILSLVANSKTSRPEIESILETSVGPFLEKLELDFGIIKKIRPILAKPTGRTVKYEIVDNFLCFWFRFVFKNYSAVEIGNFGFLKAQAREGFSTFSGKMLERYFVEQVKEAQRYSQIGTYWERGNSNEIDLVAVNSVEKRAVFGEVKVNAAKINLDALRQKSQRLAAQFPDYELEYRGLSLEDM
ncbi:ATP-binding protein [Algoriphagus sp. H41]|uniref:ATP-binding protein n=1 Tax=Algoriphagus oliviformis TaxID=2811231 RepID=A0ABS3C3K9_9BACT|nr:ATP-binding protein [Algoriphagus oliviformis]MBN7811563.1 ATP-binding protein [Algoriphagus oliviformis]